jgi:hypothetical protein
MRTMTDGIKNNLIMTKVIIVGMSFSPCFKWKNSHCRLSRSKVTCYVRVIDDRNRVILTTTTYYCIAAQVPPRAAWISQRHYLFESASKAGDARCKLNGPLDALNWSQLQPDTTQDWYIKHCFIWMLTFGDSSSGANNLTTSQDLYNAPLLLLSRNTESHLWQVELLFGPMPWPPNETTSTSSLWLSHDGRTAAADFQRFNGNATFWTIRSLDNLLTESVDIYTPH